MTSLPWHSLVEENLPLAQWVVNRFRNTGLDEEDLLAVAQLGLVQAARAFNPERAAFSTFAVAVMSNAIRTFLRYERKVARLQPEYLPQLQGDHHHVVDVAARRGWRTSDDSVDTMDLFPIDEKGFEWFESQRSFYEEVRTLEPRQQEVILLKLAGFNQVEIGERLGMSQMNVSRIYRLSLRKIASAV